MNKNKLLKASWTNKIASSRWAAQLHRNRAPGPGWRPFCPCHSLCVHRSDWWCMYRSWRWQGWMGKAHLQYTMSVATKRSVMDTSGQMWPRPLFQAPLMATAVPCAALLPRLFWRVQTRSLSYVLCCFWESWADCVWWSSYHVCMLSILRGEVIWFCSSRGGLQIQKLPDLNKWKWTKKIEQTTV